MSRKATSWSYGPEVLGLKLTARDLAILRAICWSIHPKLRRTRPLTGKALARLTGVESPTMQGASFKRLNKLGLLARQHANELPRKDGEPPLTTTAYVYSIPALRSI